MLKTRNILAGLGVIAVLGASMVPMGAYAETEATTKVRVGIETAASISVDRDMVNTDIFAGSDVNSQMVANVRVSTNVDGYQLTMMGADGNTDLAIKDTNISIPTDIPAKGKSAWAYSIDGNVKQIPSQPTVIKTYDTKTSGDITSITFPVSVESKQAPGTYEGAVVFTVTASN